MKKNPKTKEQLLAENEDLRRRLEEAEETLRAIQEGNVDALVLSKPEGEVVFTLKGAEQPYRVFVEAMNEGAATLDPEGTILYCNNRFAEMLNTPADTLIGSSIYRFIPATGRSAFESAFQEGKQRDTTADITLKSEAQQPVPVHLSLCVLPGQEMPVLCMVAMDLTEHKRLEEALRQLNADLEKRVQDRTAELVKVNETLRESEQRWATTLASIGDAVIATCEEGRIRFMNAVAEALTGWTLSEASQKPVKQVFNIINEHTRMEVEDPVGRVIETGVICGLANHTLLIRKDGTEVAIDDSGAPIRDETGKLMGVVLTFRDITERRRAEEALRKAHDELEVRVLERTRELASLNDDLTAENEERLKVEIELRESEEQVRLFASQCLTAQETERRRIAAELHDSTAASLAAVRFRIEKTREDVKKGLDVTESLQDLSSNVAQSLAEVRRIMTDLRPSVLDDLGILPALNWFCREYQKTYAHISVEKQMGIEEQEVPDSLRTPIFRIAQEAMNNVAKHSLASLVKLAIQKEGEKILLSIQDNGVGFDPGTASKGMGLSSIRERAQLSGGAFELQSGMGKGTTIRVSWPR
jgi:PAS domain S-box-containing protein